MQAFFFFFFGCSGLGLGSGASVTCARASYTGDLAISLGHPTKTTGLFYTTGGGFSVAPSSRWVSLMLSDIIFALGQFADRENAHGGGGPVKNIYMYTLLLGTLISKDGGNKE